MPEKVATQRIAEIVGFDPLDDGTCYLIFREIGGTEYGVKIPKELLGRLTIVSSSAYHTLVESADKPTPLGELPAAQAFGLWNSVATVDRDGNPYLRIELDTGLPLGLTAGRQEAGILLEAVKSWIALIDRSSKAPASH